MGEARRISDEAGLDLVEISPTAQPPVVKLIDFGKYKYELQKKAQEAKKKQIAGDVKASWGEQMRSYVMDPYQMVKDLRTDYEVNNPSAVFDGELDGFIDAGIRWRKQSQNLA